MATQYSTLLKLALPTQGELSGNWGDVVNNNITSMIEEAVAGLKTIDTWSTNSATLSTADGTTAEARAAILNLTDTTSDLSGAATLICPALSKVYIVKNGTGQAVTVKTSSGSGIAVPNGTTGFLFCDGTNVVESLNNVTGNLTVGGNASVGGNLTVTGTTTFNGGTVTLGDANTDNIVFGGEVDSNIIPDDDGTYDLGSSSKEWKDIYIDGIAYIDAVNLDGTAITSTAAEINILDGVTSTAAEINIIDGDTSASSVTVADADRVVLNDGGTMKQVAVTDLSAYFDDEITAMPNLVTTAATTVGTLNSGAVSSGFGNIDIGSSNLTATGTISLGAASFNDNNITNVGSIQLDSIAGDADTNTSITFSGSDVITMATGGTTALTIDASQNVTVAGDLTVSGDDITMGTNTSGNLLIADGTNFNSIAVGSLSEISTIASDDVFLAVDTSGGGLKKVSRSTVVSGLATSSAISNLSEDTSPQLGGNLDTNSQNILIDDAHFIGDENGNEQLIFQTTSSAVNQLDITNAATGNGPTISSTGGDTNINLNLTPKGSGVVMIDGTVGIDTGKIDLKNSGTASQILFYCESSNAHAQTLQGAPHAQGATNTLVLPDGGNGTLVSTVSTATLTNKTLTTPIIAEIDATSNFTLDAGGNITLDADGGTITFSDAGSSLGTITSAGYSGTAATTTVTDSTANTNFPVVFHNESNGLLDDTGALRYNPSTGQLLVPNLTVAGTTTTVNTVTMNAANAVVFEGATADDHETTLTIIDPTADRTINLPNVSGTIPVLAAASNTAITSTPAELNILDGVTSTAAELNILDGVTSTAAELNILDGVTSTAAELNILDGVTSTAAELNILDGVTSTATELNIMDGNTSATSTTLVDADRLVTNDNGTMKQVALSDVKTYLSSAGFATDDPTALAIALG